MWPSQEKILDWAVGVLLWLGLGFGLGWYYTITYFGSAGWPMPLPESLGAVLMYYFSVSNLSTELQAVHWMITFPVVGLLWIAVLTTTAPYYEGKRAEFSVALQRFSATTLPLSLGGIWLAYVAATSEGNLSFGRMIDVALRRAFVTPWEWLSPVFLILALLCLGLQVYAYQITFRVRGRKAWTHFLTSACILVVLACGIGTIVAIPLRALSEPAAVAGL